MDNHSNLAALIIVMTAAVSFINYRFIHLPHTIGLTVFGIALSAAIIVLDTVFPDYQLREQLEKFVGNIGFDRILLNGMLSFLLFAGALQIDMKELHEGRRDVLLLSITSVVISTLVIGVVLHFISGMAGFYLPLAWCFVFGALISPTDAVSVIALLKNTGVPKALETRISAESLFNDGVGVVVFSLAYTTATTHQDISLLEGMKLFLIEGIGGGCFGFVIGWLAYRSLRAVDDPPIETMITLALVMGGYALANYLGLSSIVAMAVAGVVIAKFGTPLGMTDRSRNYILGFWTTIEEILNSVLFLLIGLEVIVLLGGTNNFYLAAAAIPIVLVARGLSLVGPLIVRSLFAPVTKKGVTLLWWGGLRGGISIALALSLPQGPTAEVLQTMTYFVVVFSVIVQGGTLKILARRFYPVEEVSTGQQVQ